MFSFLLAQELARRWTQAQVVQQAQVVLQVPGVLQVLVVLLAQVALLVQVVRTGQLVTVHLLRHQTQDHLLSRLEHSLPDACNEHPEPPVPLWKSLYLHSRLPNPPCLQLTSWNSLELGAVQRKDHSSSCTRELRPLLS
jgi:hypothetical protein